MKNALAVSRRQFHHQSRTAFAYGTMIHRFVEEYTPKQCFGVFAPLLGTRFEVEETPEGHTYSVKQQSNGGALGVYAPGEGVYYEYEANADLLTFFNDRGIDVTVYEMDDWEREPDPRKALDVSL